LTLELLFEVGPGSNWEDAGVRLLAKKVLGPPCSTSICEEGKGPEDFFLIAGELLQGQAQIQHAEVEEGSSRTPFTREVWRRRKFGLVCCLDGADRTREEGLTGDRDMGIGGGATVGAGAVMS